MNSSQCGRARRIDRDTRTPQIQAIRNPVCGNAVRAPGGRMRSDTEMIKTRALDSLIIIMRNADENSEIGSFFEIEDESGIFDRLPCGLEEKSVLGIHIRSFPWRNAKE